MRSNTLSVQPAVTSGRSNYLTILEDAWQAHLAPRAADAPTVISTFAGAGGSSLGYSMAGYRELLAVEWDDNAVETFRLNFPDVPVYHGDIAKLSVEQVLDMTGLQPGQLDVFDGSPPCQGFSTAGKRVMDDPRNGLFREYVRLLRGLRPKVFVMENVSGMVKGKMKLIFAEILRELKASGYKVSARLMNAMYFNVPQSRERMIFIGVRNDLEIEPSHPRAEAQPVTVREAWEDIDNQTFGPEVKGQTLDRLQKCKPGQDFEDIIGVRSNFSFKRTDFDRPCWSVPKSGSLAGYCYLFHPTEHRGLTLEELKRVSSYPDGMHFTDFQNGMNRIGNSVPPLFMRAIALHIRRHILDNLQGDINCA